MLTCASLMCYTDFPRDKHDRPYKCREDGCEKLPGFTYSGGLLRHEREVHGKHGGPRKQLNCPHPNCKRHQGKGFSRQENLNEHLRRVHTDNMGQQEQEVMEENDDKTGQKRKRATPRGNEGDIHEEVKRLKAENEELRRSTEFMQAQIREMQQQMPQLHHQQLQEQLQHNQLQELQRHSMQEMKSGGMPQARMQ